MEIKKTFIRSYLKEDLINAYVITAGQALVVLGLTSAVVVTVAILVKAGLGIDLPTMPLLAAAIFLAYLYEQRHHVKRRVREAYAFEEHVQKLRKLESGLDKRELPTNLGKPTATYDQPKAPPPKWTPFVDDETED